MPKYLLSQMPFSSPEFLTYSVDFLRVITVPREG